MPLNPPADSCLTAPVYFGLRLPHSAVVTPKRLRTHLHAVRRDLQCDFIVIPTAAACSYPASAAAAAATAEVIIAAADDATTDVCGLDEALEMPTLVVGKAAISAAALQTPESGEKNPTAPAESALAANQGECFTARVAVPFEHLASSVVSSANDISTSSCSRELLPSSVSSFPLSRLSRAAAGAETSSTGLSLLATNAVASTEQRDSSSSRKNTTKARIRSDTAVSYSAVDGGLKCQPPNYLFEPSTESDLALDSNTWGSVVVCELSPWISPDEGVVPPYPPIQYSMDLLDGDIARAGPCHSAAGAVDRIGEANPTGADVISKPAAVVTPSTVGAGDAACAVSVLAAAQKGDTLTGVDVSGRSQPCDTIAPLPKSGELNMSARVSAAPAARDVDSPKVDSETHTPAVSSALPSLKRIRKQKKHRNALVKAHLQHELLQHWSFHAAAWQREMEWATHVGAFAVIAPVPRQRYIPIEYSRLLKTALSQLQPLTIWVQLPLVFERKNSSRSSSGEFTSSGSGKRSSDSDSSSPDDRTADSSSADSFSPSRGEIGAYRTRNRRYDGKQRRRHQRNTYADPWELWNAIRKFVGHHPSLGICLEISADLPDEDCVLDRWLAEPLRAVLLTPSIFNSNNCVHNSISEGGNDANIDSNQVAANGGWAAYAAATKKCTDVKLSPRHFRFLMNCAQHRVKIIFKEDEEDEYAEQYMHLAQQQGQHQQEETVNNTNRHKAGGVESPLPSWMRGSSEQVQTPSHAEFPSLAAATSLGKADVKLKNEQRLQFTRGSAASTKLAASSTAVVSPSEKPKFVGRRCFAAESASSLYLVNMQPYISYVARELLKLPTLPQTELFSAPYRDVLQSPMQPLADNLSAVNYEVFEKDPVKYLRYKQAILLRLQDIWPSRTQKEQQRGNSQECAVGRQPELQIRQQLPQGCTQAEGVQSHLQEKRHRSRCDIRYAADSSRSVSHGVGDEAVDEEGEEVGDWFLQGLCTLGAQEETYDICNSKMNSICWCLEGSNCPIHASKTPNRLVLTIVGAGRGPLVQASLDALCEAGIPLCRVRVLAVEKNWNAVVTLRSRVRSDPCCGWRAVEIVEGDMREAGDRVDAQADILISELLGSFGDNELSPECLDGAQMRLLKRGGISIPAGYVSTLEPVCAHRLWQAIDNYNDAKHFECAYVVNMFARYFPAREGPKECFYFCHPNPLLPYGDDHIVSAADGTNATVCKDDAIRYTEKTTIKDCTKLDRDTRNTTSDAENSLRSENVDDYAVVERGAFEEGSKLRADVNVIESKVVGNCIGMDSYMTRNTRAEQLPANGDKSHLRVRVMHAQRRWKDFTATELTALRQRRTRVSWHMKTNALIHGLAGYFHCCLYKNIYISIDPRSFSRKMFSWFPLFLPFRVPVFVQRNEPFEIYLAREGDEHKVWYEWAVLRPSPSEIYNHGGRHYYVGK